MSEFAPSARKRKLVLARRHVNWRAELPIRPGTRMNRPTLYELKAGEISIHSDLLLHGSEPTGRRGGAAV
jgi:hypothetical protein